MRIRHIAIDGYGRFSRRTMDFSPGLQVILGPNEQGKTTMRGFIADMLYGQKRSTTQRLYDDSNELHKPWINPDCYGGRLLYQLDNGTEIEVFRSFDRKNETVHVFDRTRARDVTAEFDQPRNREPLFAQAHLGLSKDVFSSTATITHINLEDLGDADALAQVREKVLSLADSGDENSSADSALKHLELRVAAIGQPNARTRPLPAARAQILELNREYELASALRNELAGIEEKRRGILDEIAGLQEQRGTVEEDLKTLERAERASRLIEAQELDARIRPVTQRCFALSNVREFPLEQEPDVRRAEMLVTAARSQLDRSRNEKVELERQIETELNRMGDAASFAMKEIPEEYDSKLAEIEEKIRECSIHLEEIEAAKAAAKARLETAQQELAAVPDFSRLADDPVTWLHQLANSFRIALEHRNRECADREVLRQKIHGQREILKEPDHVFSGCPDFLTIAREYEVGTRMHDEQMAQFKAAAHDLHTSSEEYLERIPFYFWMSIVSPAVVLALIIAGVVANNRGPYIPAAVMAVASLIFLVSLLYVRVRAKQTTTQFEQAQAKINEMRAKEDEVPPVEQMMIEAHCQTVRELEAKYERYRADTLELESLLKAGEIQEKKAQEAEHRVSQLFEVYRGKFRETGEELASESDVEEAAGRAVARYQEYRDAKRRFAENREQVERREAEAVPVRERLESLRKEEIILALEVRRMMRENGYPEEGKHARVLSALRSYRIRNAQQREKRGRVDVLQEKNGPLEHQIQMEERDLEQHDDALTRWLAAASVESVEQWQERAEQAREYRVARQELATLQEQLAGLLKGETLEALQAAADADEPVLDSPQQTAGELQQQRETLAQAIDACNKDEHALHLMITERSAGTRSLNEIEEDRGVTEARIRDLEVEMRAAAYAMTLIESIAQDRHSRIAPRLAAAASQFLGEITGGAYQELLVSRELDISVRIPQLQRMSENPECMLSKGTVDQIYLALRLAMVQSLSENGESIPMLLDDPFANYDDDRLGRTMALLLQLAENNQILLFSCREDVARAAEILNVPIVRL